MARRSDHSQEEIKAMILSAAEMIVVEQGFSALTVRRVAAQIGYTVGSVYMVFDNMADLILHINARTLDHLVASLGQTQHCIGTSSVEAFACAYVRYAGQHLNRWRLVFDYHWPENTPLPAWYQAKIDKLFERVEAQFVQLNPDDCSQARKKHAARVLWAGIHGICVLSLNGTLDRADADEVEDRVILLARHFVCGWMSANQH